MIFKQWKQVLDGTKTQTRRPVKKTEILTLPRAVGLSYPAPTVLIDTQRWGIAPFNYRIKWQVGRTYAVQPGRGKKAIWYHPAHPCYGIDVWPDDERVGGWKDVALGQGYVEARVRIMEIAKRKLLDIVPSQIVAEGITLEDGATIENYIVAFAELWDSIYKKPYRWRDNPDVWALQFELA